VLAADATISFCDAMRTLCPHRLPIVRRAHRSLNSLPGKRRVAPREIRCEKGSVKRLFEYGVGELAELIRAGDVSAREVVLAHLDRIDEHNAYLGAITVTLRPSALAAADACDHRDRNDRGPFHGVPFSVKENLDCMGSATTHGVPSLRDAMPYADCPAVERLKRAGAIVIARTNLSEMGLRLCADNPLRGRTLNPYDRRLTAGGSSSGDAVAVATGMVPLGIGSDMGGSLRIPAHCAGVATLKPTTGRVPHAATLEPRDHGMAGQAMLAIGPIARSVDDLRRALAVLAGRDPRDPRSVDAPLTGPEAPRRAAVVTRLPGAPLSRACLAAIERAVAGLRTAGWEVEEALPPELSRVDDVFRKILATDLSALAPALAPALSEKLAAHLQRLVRAGRLHEASNHRIHSERSRLTRAWSSFFAEFPVVLGPNFGAAIWPNDADLDPAHGIDLLQETVRFMTPGNVLGIPCVALPMGVAPGGLPTSVAIYADLWREDLCLRAAADIECGQPAVPIDPVRA
jgi:amidase